MNLDAIWSIEPIDMEKNLMMMSLLISTCETVGFDTQLPTLGIFTFEDVVGFTVAFSMLSHYIRNGRHCSNYTQYFTIRKQRSDYSNVYLTSEENEKSGMIIASNSQYESHITHCPANLLWFS